MNQSCAKKYRSEINKVNSTSINAIGFLFAVMIFPCLMNCKSENKEKQEVESVLSTYVQNQHTPETQMILEILDSVGFIELPVFINFDSSVQNHYRIIFSPQQPLTAQIEPGGDMYVIGFLPDTTNYYGMVINMVAAVTDALLVTFDKQGKKIDKTRLTEQKCLHYVGEIFLCKEFTKIDTNLSLDYVYKSVISYDLAEPDTVCENFTRRGKILETGEIEMSELLEIECSATSYFQSID